MQEFEKIMFYNDKKKLKKKKKMPKDQKWHRKKGFKICQKLPTSAKKCL